MKQIPSLLALLVLFGLGLAQKTTLTVGVFPNLDDALKAQIQLFNKKYPDVEVKLVIQQYADHQTPSPPPWLPGRACPTWRPSRLALWAALPRGRVSRI